MPRNVSNIAAALAQTQGKEPILVLRVWWEWDSDIAYYAERNMLTIPGSILNISGLDSICKISHGGGASGSITVTLSDPDKAIKTRFDTNPAIHKCYCFLYQAFDANSTNEAEWALLFQGQLSTPIVWDELARTFTFDILGEVELNEAGFTVEQGQFTHVPSESIGKIWPIVFGTVNRVPAVQVSSQLVGKVVEPTNKITKSELQSLLDICRGYAPVWREYLKAEPKYEYSYGTPTIDHFLEITRKRTEYLIKIEQLRRHFYNKLPTYATSVDQLLTNYMNWQYNVHVLDTLNRQKLSFMNTIAQYEQAIINHTGNAQMVAFYEGLITKLTDGYTSDVDGEHVNGITELDTLITQFEDAIDTILPYIKAGEQALTDKWGTTTFTIENGEEFPQNTSIAIRIKNARVQGTFNGNIFTPATDKPIIASYLNVVIAEREDINPLEPNYAEFWITDADIVLKGMYCLIHTEDTDDSQYKIFYVVDQIGKRCFIKPILWKRSINTDEEVKYDQLLIEPTAVPKILEAAPVILASWIESKIDTLDPETLTGYGYDYNKDETDKPWAIEVGDIVTEDIQYPVVYVCNQKPSTSITEVMAYRTINGRRLLTPVPSSYYTKYLSYTLGTMTPTVITFKHRLSTYKDEDWEDEIFVSLVDAESNNVADIIKWLVEKYTGYICSSFVTVTGQLAKYPANFAILERKNVLQLMEEIAWQSRCVLTIYNNVVYLKYISTQPGSYDAQFTEADIILDSVTVACSRTDDLVTKLCGRWKRHYAQEYPYEVTVRNNVFRYGHHKQDADFYIYNNEALVRKSLTFWIIRYSNTWKIIHFKTTLKHIKLQAYDFVSLTFSTLDPLGTGVNTVDGYVLNAVYNPDDYTISFEIWTAVRVGENFNYDLAWPSSSSLSYPTAYDFYAGGASDPRADRLLTGGETDFGFEYGVRPHDIGNEYNNDSYDTAPTIYPLGREVDYSIIPKYAIDREKEVKLDIHSTKIYDSQTGLNSTLDTLINIVRGIPGLYISAIQSGDEERLITSLALKQSFFISGIHQNNITGDPKNVFAPFPTDFVPGLNIHVPTLQRSQPFLARLTGYTSLTTNLWKYNWQEVRISSNHNIDSSYFPGQRDGSEAYNTVELINNGIGIEGNSVDHDGASFPASFSMKPAGAGEQIIVIMYPLLRNYTNNQLVYLFQYENADDGDCT